MLDHVDLHSDKSDPAHQRGHSTLQERREAVRDRLLQEQSTVVADKNVNELHRVSFNYDIHLLLFHTHTHTTHTVNRTWMRYYRPILCSQTCQRAQWLRGRTCSECLVLMTRQRYVNWSVEATTVNCRLAVFLRVYTEYMVLNSIK